MERLGMYTFLFDRRSLALFLIGAAAAAALIFVGGVQIGRKLELPAQPVAVAELEPLSALESGPAAETGPSPARHEASNAVDAARPEPAANSESYFVQVGAFELEENARRQTAALAAEGFESYVVPFRTASGQTLIAVRFGRYDSLEDALEGAERYVELVPGREASVGQ